MRRWQCITMVVAAVAIIGVIVGCRSGQKGTARGGATRLKEIEFVPIGSVDKSLIETVAKKVAKAYGASYKIASTPMELPEKAYDPTREQYLAEALLDGLKKRPEAKKGYALGIADVDLYAPELNFVFGQAELPGTVAVISLTRLRPEFWRRKPDPALLVKRAVKEAVHELGHDLGLEHCDNPRCVMRFSNSLADTDYKGERFCDRCAANVR